MDYRVDWSPEATEGIEAIAELIGRDSTFYARAVVTKILLVAKTIANLPHMGRVVPELNDERIKERLVYSYRLIYSIVQQQILIVAVVQGNHQLESVTDPTSGGIS